MEDESLFYGYITSTNNAPSIDEVKNTQGNGMGFTINDDEVQKQYETAKNNWLYGKED